MDLKEIQRALGPSCLHSLGAVGVVYLLGFIGGLVYGVGIASAYYGAGLMTGWFLAREVEQIIPHLGTNDFPTLSEEQITRAMRQSIWPAFFAHLAATSIWVTSVLL